MSDPDIVARSLRDPHAFEELVTSLGPRVHAYLRRRAPEHADDLLSEVLLAAFRGRHQYDENRAEVAAWMFGIARHVLFSHLRRSVRESPAAMPSAFSAPDSAGDAYLDDWDAVDRRLDAAGTAHALRHALAALPVEEREVLLLIAWEQLTPSEAAAVLGIPAGTARSRLHRARARLTTAWNTSVTTVPGGPQS